MRYSAVVPTILIWTALTSPALGQVTIQPYIGGYWFDDDALGFGFQDASFDVGPILGVQVGFPIWKGLVVGGRYGYASLPHSITVETVTGDRLTNEFDASEHLYFGIVEYGFWSDADNGVFITGELGGATYSPEEGENSSDVMAGFGAGIGFRQNERVGISVEVRDHLRFCSQGRLGEEASLCLQDDDVFHNLELSAGATIRF